jgi:hypothetical protein
VQAVLANVDCRFAYSLDGRTFTDAPSTFRMGFQSWKGGRPAVYSYGPNGGYVDADDFRYDYGGNY